MQSRTNKTLSNKTNKIALLGVLLALSLILSYIESLIPFNFGVPGIKLGLANLIVVILLYMKEPREAIIINFLRIVLSGFLFGNLSMIIYSLAGAILSIIIMIIVKQIDKFSIAGVSLLGAVFHNVGQCIVASIVVSNYRVTYYLPILIIVGAITGLVIGYIARIIIPLIQSLWRK